MAKECFTTDPMPDSPADVICGVACLAQLAYEWYWNLRMKKAWELLFSAPCAAVLRPEQRVTLPGEASKVGWQGGDATPEVAALADWRDKFYVREAM